MAQVKITKTGSTIEKTERVKRTMKALGLNKIGDTNTMEHGPEVEGMLKKVKHLLKIEKV